MAATVLAPDHGATGDRTDEGVADVVDLAECRALAEQLIEEHLPGLGWRFTFDSARKRGGLCRSADKTISMSRLLVPLWTREMVRQTILHEIGHALVFERGLHRAGVRPHGREWLAAARSIGYAGGVRHSNPTLPPRTAARVVPPPSHTIVPEAEPTVAVPTRDATARQPWRTVADPAVRRLTVDHLRRTVLVPAGQDAAGAADWVRRTLAPPSTRQEPIHA
ncbi:MAG TPA: SprT-like domain-containing protein [Nocardioides sp.]|nr:SprT-like domain-containing protein [Nocardioides sp.]